MMAEFRDGVVCYSGTLCTRFISIERAFSSMS